MLNFYPGDSMTRYFVQRHQQRVDAAESLNQAREARIRAELRCRRIDRMAARPSGEVNCRGGGAEIEVRSIAPVLNVERSERIITVVAVPYEQPARVPFRGDVWSEVFARSAFAGIESRQDRVPVTACLSVPNVNHDGGHIVGRMIAAYPRRSEGLVTDLKIARTAVGDETMELAAEGALSVSIGFAAAASGQVLDPRTRTRRITRALLDHVAFVGQPAYQGAKVLAVRSRSSETALTPEDWHNDPVAQWARRYISRVGNPAVLRAQRKGC